MITQTLEGWKIEMRAACQYGHPYERMSQDHINKRFVCDRCGQTLTPERIYEDVPEAYRPSGNPLLSGLQGLLDYEIEGVVTESGELLITYPRRSVEGS